LYPETFEELYKRVTEEVISVFEYMEVSLDEAIEILTDLSYEHEPSPVGNSIRVLIDEMPDILIQQLIERYKEMLNYDDGIYTALIWMLNDEES
jgi:hypothetical protein